MTRSRLLDASGSIRAKAPAIARATPRHDSAPDSFRRRGFRPALKDSSGDRYGSGTDSATCARVAKPNCPCGFR